MIGLRSRDTWKAAAHNDTDSLSTPFTWRHTKHHPVDPSASVWVFILQFNNSPPRVCAFYILLFLWKKLLEFHMQRKNLLELLYKEKHHSKFKLKINKKIQQKIKKKINKHTMNYDKRQRFCLCFLKLYFRSWIILCIY